MGRTRLPISIALWLVVTSSASSLSAQEGPSREYLLKAGFVYNFIQFVQWPAKSFADENSPIVIGILGDDPFRGALDQAMNGKKVGGRALIVKHLQRSEEAVHVHVLYVSALADRMFPDIPQRLVGLPVLSIGEDPLFMAQGGIIRFYVEQNKLRFEINVGMADKSKLKISARLLQLAKIYRPPE